MGIYHHFQAPSPINAKKGKKDSGGVLTKQKGKEITMIIWKLENEKTAEEVKKRPL